MILSGSIDYPNETYPDPEYDPEYDPVWIYGEHLLLLTVTWWNVSQIVAHDFGNTLRNEFCHCKGFSYIMVLLEYGSLHWSLHEVGQQMILL